MKNILCYGTSNVWGFIPGSLNMDTFLGKRYDENTRWPCLLQKHLGDQFHVIEEGLNGRTTQYDDDVAGKPYRNGLATLPMILEAHHPLDLVIFFIGTNDQKIQFNQSNEAIAQGMRLLVEGVLKSNRGINAQAPKVLLIAPQPIKSTASPDYFDDSSIQKSRKIAAHYQDIANELGCEFLNAGKYIQSSPIDGIHLDENGHGEIARVISEKVKSIFN